MNKQNVDIQVNPTYDVVEQTDQNPDVASREAALIHAEPVSANVVVPGAVDETTNGSLAALLSREVSEPLRTRWNEIQGKFVDEPRTAVQEADALVAEVVGQIIQMFAKEHTALEGQWKEGKDVSTEDLRQALQRYRSFFNRLVV